MLNKDCKQGIIKQFSRSEKDSGSSEVQIALLSKRIQQIAEHLKSFPKDKHSRFGLIKLVGKRRTFYRYLKDDDKTKYDALMIKLKDQKYI